MKKYKFLLLALLLSSKAAFALEDNLMKSLEISNYANQFQSERLKIAAENMANEDSVATKPDEDPYRRKTIYASNRYDRNKKTRLVKVRKYDFDKTPFRLRYDPYHPAADANGYVKMPNVNKLIEKADASEAQRAYEANLGMIEISKQMINKTIEAMR